MLLVSTARGAVLAFCDAHCRDCAGFTGGATQPAKRYCLTCFACAATYCVPECPLCLPGWSCGANAWLASIEPILALRSLARVGVPITDEIWRQLIGYSESVWDGDVISDIVRRGYL